MAIDVSVSVNEFRCIVPTKTEAVRSALLRTGLKINGFRANSGKDYGIGHFLLVRNDLNQLVNDDTITVTITDGNSTVTIGGLFILESRALVPNDTIFDLFLVTLVDYRFFPQKYSSREDDSFYPVHSKFNPTGSFASTNLEGLESYWSESTTGLTAGNLITASNDLPTQLFRDVLTPYGSTVWNTFNDILSLTSHRLYKRLDGSENFEILPLKDDNSNNLNLVTSADNRIDVQRQDTISAIPIIPRNLSVSFRQLDHQFFNKSLTFINPYAGSEPTLDVAYKLDLPNVYSDCDDDESDTYRTTLQSLATKCSELFYDSLSNHNVYNAVYFGVIPFTHSPTADVIEYYHDLVDNKYKTLVKSVDFVNFQFPRLSTELEDRYYYNIDVSPECDCPTLPGIKRTDLTEATLDTVIGYEGECLRRGQAGGVTFNRATVGEGVAPGATGILRLADGTLTTGINYSNCTATLGDLAFALQDNNEWVYTICSCCGDCCDRSFHFCVNGVGATITTNGGGHTFNFGTCGSFTNVTLEISLTCENGVVSGSWEMIRDGGTPVNGIIDSDDLNSLCNDSAQVSHTWFAESNGCDIQVLMSNYLIACTVPPPPTAIFRTQSVGGGNANPCTGSPFLPNQPIVTLDYEKNLYYPQSPTCVVTVTVLNRDSTLLPPGAWNVRVSVPQASLDSNTVLQLNSASNGGIITHTGGFGFVLSWATLDIPFNTTITLTAEIELVGSGGGPTSVNSNITAEGDDNGTPPPLLFGSCIVAVL